jgi:GR25 family glycosyltransferase involved in LPS biosynthesis
MLRATSRKKQFNIFNIPTYVISMKERPERWKRYTEQPVTNKFKHARRSNAINGKKLKYVKDRRISVRTRLNIFRNYRRSHHEIATLGAVGCSLSHIDVWKKFLNTGAKYCFIMEDDCILTDETFTNVNKLIPTLPPMWGVWLLGMYKPNLVFSPMDVKPWNRVYSFTASHAYVITRDAAKTFLQDAFPVESHIDHYISAISVLKDICMVQHPEIHIEFFQEKMSHSPTTTVDSNTSQHKKNGCPLCKIPDDWAQIYKSPTRKTHKGMRVRGLVKGQQSRKIRRFRN